MLGIGKAARLHTATAENQATHMKRVGKTEGWVATAAWTAGFALLLTILTGGIWTALVLANLATTPAIPWAVAAMALLLWSLWSYLGGSWRPYGTGEARRRYLRARRVSGLIFTWALLAGALSVVSLAGLWIVMFRLVRMPGNAVMDLSRLPSSWQLRSSLWRHWFHRLLRRQVSGATSKWRWNRTFKVPPRS